MDASSLYFKDLNEGLCEEKTYEVVDCEGNITCVSRKVPLPYKQAREILAPVFIDTTMGGIRYYKSKITKSLYFERGRAYIEIDKPLQVGDILSLSGSTYSHYFIKSKKRRRTPLNHFVIEIKRMDKSLVLDVDKRRLKKGKRLVVTGQLKNQK